MPSFEPFVAWAREAGVQERDAKERPKDSQDPGLTLPARLQAQGRLGQGHDSSGAMSVGSCHVPTIDGRAWSPV
jgi:hypothetical protein